MAGIAIDLPIVGDFIDGTVLLVAAIVMFGKVKQFISDAPGGLATVPIITRASLLPPLLGAAGRKLAATGLATASSTVAQNGLHSAHTQAAA